jgi:ERF superfamily
MAQTEPVPVTEDTPVSKAPMLESAGELAPDLPVHVLFARAFRALQPIAKRGRNKEQNFDFRAIEDIYDEVRRVLADSWLFPIPRCLEMIPESRPASNNRLMHVVRLHIRFTFYGPKGDKIVGSMWGEGADMGDKSMSKAATMAEKSALIGMFCIAGPDADPDSQTLPETRQRAKPTPQPRRPAQSGQPVKSGPPKTVHTTADAPGEAAPEPGSTDDDGIVYGGSTPAQWGSLSQLAAKLGWDEDEKHRQADVKKSLKELSAADAAEYAKTWAAMLSAQAKAKRVAGKAAREPGPDGAGPGRWEPSDDTELTGPALIVEGVRHRWVEEGSQP